MLIFNTVLVAAFAAQRLFELRISARNVRALRDAGREPVRDPVFPWMVWTHVLLLVGSGLEPWLAGRPFVPALGWTVLAVLVACQVLRFWVLRTLGRHWNVRIMASGGVVQAGPYRFVRHPNYVAVAVEGLCLPLFHGAWWTWIAVQCLHVPVLIARIRAEEAYLHRQPGYRAAMLGKPRFVPRLGWVAARRRAR